MPFGELISPDKARQTVLLLVRLAGMNFETAINFSFGEACLWIEAALAVESRIGTEK